MSFRPTGRPANSANAGTTGKQDKLIDSATGMPSQEQTSVDSYSDRSSIMSSMKEVLQDGDCEGMKQIDQLLHAIKANVREDTSIHGQLECMVEVSRHMLEVSISPNKMLDLVEEILPLALTRFGERTQADRAQALQVAINCTRAALKNRIAHSSDASSIKSHGTVSAWAKVEAIVKDNGLRHNNPVIRMMSLELLKEARTSVSDNKEAPPLTLPLRQFVPALVKMLDDPDSDIRTRVIQVIKIIFTTVSYQGKKELALEMLNQNIRGPLTREIQRAIGFIETKPSSLTGSATDAKPQASLTHRREASRQSHEVLTKARTQRSSKLENPVPNSARTANQFESDQAPMKSRHSKSVSLELSSKSQSVPQNGITEILNPGIYQPRVNGRRTFSSTLGRLGQPAQRISAPQKGEHTHTSGAFRPSIKTNMSAQPVQNSSQSCDASLIAELSLSDHEGGEIVAVKSNGVASAEIAAEPINDALQAPFDEIRNISGPLHVSGVTSLTISAYSEEASIEAPNSQAQNDESVIPGPKLDTSKDLHGLEDHENKGNSSSHAQSPEPFSLGQDTKQSKSTDQVMDRVDEMPISPSQEPLDQQGIESAETEVYTEQLPKDQFLTELTTNDGESVKESHSEPLEIMNVSPSLPTSPQAVNENVLPLDSQSTREPEAHDQIDKIAAQGSIETLPKESLTTINSLPRDLESTSTSEQGDRSLGSSQAGVQLVAEPVVKDISKIVQTEEDRDVKETVLAQASPASTQNEIRAAQRQYPSPSAAFIAARRRDLKHLREKAKSESNIIVDQDIICLQTRSKTKKNDDPMSAAVGAAVASKDSLPSHLDTEGEGKKNTPVESSTEVAAIERKGANDEKFESCKSEYQRAGACETSCKDRGLKDPPALLNTMRLDSSTTSRSERKFQILDSQDIDLEIPVKHSERKHKKRPHQHEQENIPLPHTGVTDTHDMPWILYRQPPLNANPAPNHSVVPRVASRSVSATEHSGQAISINLKPQFIFPLEPRYQHDIPLQPLLGPNGKRSATMPTLGYPATAVLQHGAVAGPFGHKGPSDKTSNTLCRDLPSVEGLKVIKINSASELDNDFADNAKYFHDKETEQNWTPREKFITRIRAMLHGNAHQMFPDSFERNINGFGDSILKVMKSLRTTVASHGCHLVSDLAIAFGHRLSNATVALLASGLAQMASLTKKIVANLSQLALQNFIIFCKYHARIAELVVAMMGDKNVQTRSFGMEHLQVLLKHHTPDGHHADGIADGLRICLSDSAPTVREAARKAFKTFDDKYPDRAANLIKKLDPQVRKRL